NKACTTDMLLKIVTHNSPSYGGSFSARTLDGVVFNVSKWGGEESTFTTFQSHLENPVKVSRCTVVLVQGRKDVIRSTTILQSYRNRCVTATKYSTCHATVSTDGHGNGGAFRCNFEERTICNTLNNVGSTSVTSPRSEERRA